MQSLVDPNGNYRVRFRLAGKYFNKSLKTKDPKQAKRQLVEIENRLIGIRRGTVAIPADLTAKQVGDFLLWGATPTITKIVTNRLKPAIDRYFATLPEGAKQPATIATERIHAGHLLRILGNCDTSQMDLQSYILKRSKEKGLKGRKVSGGTIRKELITIKQIIPSVTLKGLRLPKESSKSPFATYDQIAQQTSDTTSQLWESLFLDVDQIAEVVGYLSGWLKVAVAIAAYTGARRGEILRLTVADVDMINGYLRLASAKQSRKKKLVYRSVDLSPQLIEILRTHLAGRKTGLVLGEAIEPLIANRSLTAALRGTRWQVIRGYHVFRHSFASNCARAGIHESIIDSWLGHTNEAIRARYRHLFPSDRSRAINQVFG